MVLKTKNLLSVPVLGLAICAASNSAMAASIALSVNEITNFSMTSTGMNFSGFTFSNDTAATEGGGTGGADVSDAPAACVGGCAGWENQFGTHAPYSPEFSYGDAQIQNGDVLNGNGAASTIGEVVVTDGIAHASGSNVMTSMYLNIDPSATLNFSFNADALMQTGVSGTGLSSAANIFFNISLTDSLNNEVFSWSPDGAAGGILGGTEYSDAFDMNYGISGNTFYDPALGLFSAETNSLTGGLYSLNIKMENQVNGAAVVPVPAAVWLFASGLIGLAGFARRKKA